MPETVRKKSPLFTRAFILISIINLSVFFGFQMTNVGMPIYIAQLGANSVLVGLSTTLMTIMALAIRPFSGIILDRFGRKGILITGIVFIVVATICYMVFPIVGIILAFRLLQGVGWGLSTTASSTIAADVIPKERFAEGMGYFAMTNSISSALAPAIAVSLAQGGNSFIMLAVVTGFTVLGLVLSFFQKDTSYEVREASAHPVKGPASVSTDIAQAKERRSSKLDAFFERKAFFPSAIMLLINLGFGTITTFITLHGSEQGVSNVSIYFIAYAIVTLVTRPLIGRLIDDHGFFGPGIFACLCTVATLVLIGLADSTLLFALAGVLAGLGIGTAMGNFQTMAVSAVPPQRRGVATSTYLFAFDAGIAIGAMISGAVASMVGYSYMFIIIAAAPLVACLFFMLAGKKRIASYSVKNQH